VQTKFPCKPTNKSHKKILKNLWMYLIAYTTAI
jgi:hypothetical protein